MNESYISYNKIKFQEQKMDDFTYRVVPCIGSSLI